MTDTDQLQTNQSRPLSPHLSVYRPQWTSVYSILHRITGVMLVVGTLVIAAWLITLALNPNMFMSVNTLMASVLFKIIMLDFAFSLYYHFLNGLRHLIWDMGYGLELKFGQLSGHFCGIVALLATALTGVFAF